MRKKLPNCKQKNFLTSIVSTVHVDDPLHIMLHPEYYDIHEITSNVECCYHKVFRVHENDNQVTFSDDCIPFNDNYKLDKKNAQVFVKCFSEGKEVYKNVHAIISQQKEFEKRRKETKIDKKKAYKVVNLMFTLILMNFLMLIYSQVMVGVDSLSRMNLQRGLPKIFNEINKTDGWFGMNGYTSVSSFISTHKN